MSNINPNTIDQNYPIAGQDNDSQGFRNNFSNLKTNFQYAADELTDLQNKVVLKSALAGTTLTNDMGGSLLKSVLTQDVRGTVLNNANAQGITNVDVAAANYHKLTITGPTSLTFTNFPQSGTHGSVTVEITIVNITGTVDLPVEAQTSAIGLSGYANGTLTFPTVGKYVYTFSSTDAGASIQVAEFSRSRNQFFGTPLTDIGSPGDAQGQIKFTATRAYFCTADYNGITSIWKYIDLTALPFAN